MFDEEEITDEILEGEWETDNDWEIILPEGWSEIDPEKKFE